MLSIGTAGSSEILLQNVSENPKQPKFHNLGGERKDDFGGGGSGMRFLPIQFHLFQLSDQLPCNKLGQVSEVQNVCALTNADVQLL